MLQKLYLMRHGETLFNTQKRVQGWSDSPLTENGMAQAEKVARWFEEAGIGFDNVYSSTQERATDTAKIASRQDEIRQLKGIKEMNFGIFEAQPEGLLPKFRPSAISFEDLLVPYGGEDILEVGKRVKATILETLQSSQAPTSLMVSHGAAMWGLILELGITFPPGVYFTNCAVCEFSFDGEKLALDRLILTQPDLAIHDFRGE